MASEVVVWHWLAFGGLVAVLLALDLFVFHRHDRAPTFAASAGWTAFWCGLAAAFNLIVWLWLGSEAGVSFTTGYVIEWTLSMDNVFVFAVIFRFFRVPARFQYRVLFWGILGAIVLRLAFVLAGSQLIHYFEWVKLLFGLLLLYTAVKLTLNSGAEVDPERSFVLRVARRLLPVTRADHQEHGHAFFVRENSRTYITPLFLVLLVIEGTDVMFAIDSVPAILVITTDPFIVFTSNIFAILGLRALYFLLAGVMDTFEYLHYGLAAVLAFLGGNMIADYFFAPENGHVIATWMKLAIVAGLLAVAIIASLVARRGAKHDRQEAGR